MRKETHSSYSKHIFPLRIVDAVCRIELIPITAIDETDFLTAGELEHLLIRRADNPSYTSGVVNALCNIRDHNQPTAYVLPGRGGKFQVLYGAEVITAYNHENREYIPVIIVEPDSEYIQ